VAEYSWSNSCLDDNSADENGGAASMKATINGESWQAVEAETFYSNGIYSIIGTDIEPGSIEQINLTGFINATGTFPINMICGVVGTYSIETSSNDEILIVGTAGELIISELTSAKTSGTFQFSVQGYTISNGQYSINF